jgi:hypothetical protein
MRPAALATLLILLVTGCVRSVKADRDDAPVRIEAVETRFEPGDHGELVLSLSVTGEGQEGTEVAGLQWELWLDKRWFAAGTHRLSESLPTSGRHAFTVTLPIVFRRATPASGHATELELGVRGGVVLRSPAGAWSVPFEHRSRARVQNAPVVDDFGGAR